MKLRTILNEIGDSAKVYDYDKYSLPQISDKSRDGNYYKIKFSTNKGTDYLVQMFVWFDDDDRLGLEVDFKTIGGDQSYYSQTNKYEMFSVMATISDMVVNTIKDNLGKIKFIRFSPTKTENDRYTTPLDQTQRGKLYMAYVKSKFSDAGIDYSYSVKGDEIIIDIK